jgi:hypothetical protein
MKEINMIARNFGNANPLCKKLTFAIVAAKALPDRCRQATDRGRHQCH